MKKLYYSLGLSVLLILSVVTIILAEVEQVIQQVSANGTRNLRPVTVRDNWEIRWDAKGQVFNVTVNPLDRDPKDPLASIPTSIASQTGSGIGSSYQPKGGTFYLQVTAVGDWTVTVVQLP